MMQATDEGQAEHVALASRLDFTWHWCISFERQVRPAAVIVVEVREQDPVQMPFIKHDYVIQTFSANRPNQAFTGGVLLRCSRGDRNLVNAHVMHAISEVLSVAAVAVANQIARSFVERKGLMHLLCPPASCRIYGHLEVNHMATIVTHDDKTVQRTKSSF